MNNLFAKSAVKPIAAFMVFWLSGVLFLVCCGTISAQAKNADFCPLAAKGKSHCNKAKSETIAPNFSKLSESSNLDCCGFLPAVFDKTRKIEKNRQIALPAAKIKVDLPKFSFVKIDFEVSAAYCSTVLNQNKIFIKNCIFRI
ncbi:MAG TPA: hypothetical protein VGC76_10390 [Pyrinomonadaceae bacterium]|jgi:hypothetical protein